MPSKHVTDALDNCEELLKHPAPRPTSTSPTPLTTLREQLNHLHEDPMNCGTGAPRSAPHPSLNHDGQVNLGQKLHLRNLPSTCCCTRRACQPCPRTPGTCRCTRRACQTCPRTPGTCRCTRRACKPCPRTAPAGPPQFFAHLDQNPDAQQTTLSNWTPCFIAQQARHRRP